MKSAHSAHSWVVIGLALGLAAATAACERRLDNVRVPKEQRVAAAPSSGQLIGTPPAPPTTADGQAQPTPVSPLQETPQTTSSSEPQKELTKAEESSQMPLPGQPNDHSNVASDASQRAGQTDPQQTPARTDTPSPPQRQSQAATQK
jgi:hypothetical protein